MTSPYRISRRRALHLLGAGTGAAMLPLHPATATASVNDTRLIVIILRGGADGLSLLAPLGDPDYAGQRRALALKSGEALPLDGFFALHPALMALHPLWTAGQLTGFHALATPYRNRSHFDAQLVLENGLDQPRGTADGWLNRAVQAMARQSGADPASLGLSVGQTPPLIMRGTVPLQSWAPTTLPNADEAVLLKIADLWAGDPVLGPHMAQALAVNDMQTDMPDMSRNARRTARRNFGRLVGASLPVLTRPDAQRVTVLEMSGWDTHVQQGTTRGRLARQFADLNAGLASLITGLQGSWHRTAILLLTEFGRAVHPNGNGGSDHGTGGAALLFGGALATSGVRTDWPGLGERNLLASRDLKPTRDLRDLYRAVLHDHLNISSQEMDQAVLPGTKSDPAFRDLFRG